MATVALALPQLSVATDPVQVQECTYSVVLVDKVQDQCDPTRLPRTA